MQRNYNYKDINNDKLYSIRIRIHLWTIILTWVIIWSMKSRLSLFKIFGQYPLSSLRPTTWSSKHPFGLNFILLLYIIKLKRGVDRVNRPPRKPTHSWWDYQTLRPCLPQPFTSTPELPIRIRQVDSVATW